MGEGVPVHDAVGVHGAHRRGHLVEDVAGLLLGEVVPLHDDVEQLPPLAVLSHDVLVLGLLEDLVDLEDAGVVLRGGRRTMRLRRETSLRVMALALGNLKVLIFLTARRWPVDSCSA